MQRSPPPGASPCKRPRTKLHYPPRKRSRLGEPATALGLSWDTVGGAGGACSVMQEFKGQVLQCLAHCLASYHTELDCVASKPRSTQLRLQALGHPECSAIFAFVLLTALFVVLCGFATKYNMRSSDPFMRICCS